MPRISSFFGIIIWINWNDHNPPHFNATYGEFEVLIKIQDLSIYSGSVPARVFGFVIEWALQHQKELMENWELAQKGLPPKKIEPLQ